MKLQQLFESLPIHFEKMNDALKAALTDKGFLKLNLSGFSAPIDYAVDKYFNEYKGAVLIAIDENNYTSAKIEKSVAHHPPLLGFIRKEHDKYLVIEYHEQTKDFIMNHESVSKEAAIATLHDLVHEYPDSAIECVLGIVGTHVEHYMREDDALSFAFGRTVNQYNIKWKHAGNLGVENGLDEFLSSKTADLLRVMTGHSSVYICKLDYNSFKVIKEYNDERQFDVEKPEYSRSQIIDLLHEHMFDEHNTCLLGFIQ